MLVPPIWCNLLDSWIQEVVISGYIKKRTLGWLVGVRDGSRGARMNFLSMYDRVPYYPTRPKFSSSARNEIVFDE